MALMDYYHNYSDLSRFAGYKNDWIAYHIRLAFEAINVMEPDQEQALYHLDEARKLSVELEQGLERSKIQLKMEENAELMRNQIYEEKAQGF